ncbi:magnesium-dependent phosphatase 1, partial [Phenoliferia sp. Uapishka_3]
MASNPDSTLRMPQLVAFDLDFTLWDLWVDTHVTPPLKRKGATDINRIYDKRGQEMSFYPEVPEILLQLHNARQALSELLLAGTLNSHLDNPMKTPSNLVSSIDLFNTLEIYPGSKLAHFKEIHKKTGIPYNEMVFFDGQPLPHPPVLLHF